MSGCQAAEIQIRLRNSEQNKVHLFAGYDSLEKPQVPNPFPILPSRPEKVFLIKYVLARLESFVQF